MASSGRSSVSIVMQPNVQPASVLTPVSLALLAFWMTGFSASIFFEPLILRVCPTFAWPHSLPCLRIVNH